MRIALLSWESKHSIAVGGMGEHVSELAAALAQRHHEVHVFTRQAIGQGTNDWIDGVYYHRCPFERHPDFLTETERMCDSFVWHFAAVESHLGSRFDIIHGHDWLSVRAMDQIKHRHGRHVVMTVHSTEFGRCGNEHWGGMSARIREQEWYGTYISERVICVSDTFRREVQQLYSVPWDKTDVIYNGVDPRRFDLRTDPREARARYEVGGGDPLVLFAGRMTQQKGPDLLLEAVPRVLAEHPRAKVVFAGEGALREPLQRRAQAMGAADVTRFVGHRTGRELVELFKCADLVCVPSRNEPFGIVILEAWSARKPVVVTRLGGPAEFVRHGDNGFSVADDSTSISDGLCTVLADRAGSRRMGRAGRRDVEEHFSWEHIAEQTESVYHRVLGNGHAAKAIDTSTVTEMDAMARSDKPNGSSSPIRPSRGDDDNQTRAAVASRRKKTEAVRLPSEPIPGETARSGFGPRTSINKPSELTDARIRERAYLIYLRRGARPGNALEDWLQAERELREELSAAVGGRS